MDSAAKQMSKQLVGDFKPTTDGQKAIVKACEKLSGKKFSELTIAELRDHLANAAKSGLPVDDIMDVSHKVANFVKDRKPPKDKLPENKGTDMNFPKLQALTEAKKKKVEDEMEMDFGDGEVAPEEDTEEKPAVDKAAVLAFLKSCDAKCRAEVCKKLQAMVEKDKAAAEK